MSIATMILGESGTGKTTSLRNLNPAETLLIQAIAKPLPFRSPDWQRFDRQKNPNGNIFQTDQAADIIDLMRRTRRQIMAVSNFVCNGFYSFHCEL